MMHELVEPLPLPGFQIDAHQAFAKQIVTRSVAAVIVRSGRLDREIDQAQIFIHGDLVPDTRVAVVGPRSIQPSVVAELAFPGDGVELPDLFPGPDIKRANQTLGIVMGFNGRAFSHRGTYNHHVSSYGRRRMDADLASLQIDLSVDSIHHANL